MLWDREEYIDLLTGKNTDRQMLVELFGLLIGLDKEWLAQGATKEEIDLTAFDFDYLNLAFCGGYTGLKNDLKRRVIEETNEYEIVIDEWGRKSKLIKGYATISLPMSYPVHDMDSWLKVKHWFEFSEDRIDWEQVEYAKKMQEKGHLVVGSIPGGYDLPRQLMGEEFSCLCYYLNPELMHDVMDTITNTTYEVHRRISDKLVIDNLSVHEDMAGKSGSLVGPNIINEYIKPYYRKTWDLVKSKGTKLFCQDSDGNMNSVLDAFMDCGVNITYPCEPAANMDVVALRKKYGKELMFKGGIDKHVLRQDKGAIRKELEYKLQPLMQQGGIVFGLDHRIPNGTPLENYRYYVQTAKEILGIPITNSTGWARMAF